MKLYFLGTGTSTGVPQMGCQCVVCRSTDPRDKRLRCSAIVETDDHRLLLIDCGPDFRQQMLRFVATHPMLDYPSLPYTLRCRTESSPEQARAAGYVTARDYKYALPVIDAVLVTHEHYDHVAGLDDLRPFSVLQKVEICAEENVGENIRRNLFYCFRDNPYPGSPRLGLQVIDTDHHFHIGNTEIIPIRVMHGRLPIVGFRIGNLAYITDMTTVPEEEMHKLQGITTLVVNALRTEPHPTHQSIQEAIAFAQKTSAQHTYFIHMSHGAGLHSVADAQLPPGIHFAFDGQEIDF